MWSKLWVVVVYLVIVATEGHPGNTKKIYQNELQTDVSHGNRTNVNLAKENTVELNADQQQSTKSYKKLPAPRVDDDLLEFLVRVADNPAEWNKIRRVLSMLGRDETGTATAAAVAADDGNHVGAAAVRTASTSTPMPPVTIPPTTPPKIAVVTAADVSNGRGPKHQPPPPPPPPPPPTTSSSPSWPSSDWIMKTVQDIKAAARARGIGAGGEDYDGDDDGNDYDYDDQADDEIEEIEEPTSVPPPPPPPQPSRPPVLRAAAGHMSRYEFKRLDGRPDDGRVNGTYVAVIESDRPPRVVIYDPARQKKPRTDK